MDKDLLAIFEQNETTEADLTASWPTTGNRAGARQPQPIELGQPTPKQQLERKLTRVIKTLTKEARHARPI